MLLAIDIGNTHIVIGQIQDRILKRDWRVPTHPLSSHQDFRKTLENTVGSLEKYDAIVLASVVPTLTEYARNIKDIPVSIIDWKWPYSFEIKANPPEKIGIDRLVNAEACIREYGAPCIVIDMGTATTICALSQHQSNRPEFLGGAIIPGLKLSMEALSEKTAQLFKIEWIAPSQAIGKNTDEALRSGSILGYTSLIDGMVQRFKKELNAPDAPVIVTGGLSFVIKGLSQEVTHYDSDLTLKGMMNLYETFLNR